VNFGKAVKEISRKGAKTQSGAVRGIAEGNGCLSSFSLRLCAFAGNSFRAVELHSCGIDSYDGG
jgi:hypothetical protein